MMKISCYLFQNQKDRAERTFVCCAQLTICLKTLESLVLEKDLSGTQRGINPSDELARARCSLAIIAFSSFYRMHTKNKEVSMLLYMHLVYTQIHSTLSLKNPELFSDDSSII